MIWQFEDSEADTMPQIQSFGSLCSWS